MKKSIITYGGIAGLVVGIYVVCLNWLGDNIYLGYATQIVAFSFIFVGVKRFRDTLNEGHIGFWKAFKIGLGITLIGSTIYVLTWLVVFYVFIPDFMDKYAAHLLAALKDSGVTGAVAEKKVAEINSMKQMYKNPFFVVMYTYVEILPTGLVISVLAALILKRRQGGARQGGASQVGGEPAVATTASQVGGTSLDAKNVRIV